MKKHRVNEWGKEKRKREDISKERKSDQPLVTAELPSGHWSHHLSLLTLALAVSWSSHWFPLFHTRCRFCKQENEVSYTSIHLLVSVQIEKPPTQAESKAIMDQGRIYPHAICGITKLFSRIWQLLKWFNPHPKSLKICSPYTCEACNHCGRTLVHCALCGLEMRQFLLP